jgi:hypothetical protein
MSSDSTGNHTSNPTHPRAYTSLWVVGFTMSSERTSSGARYRSVPWIEDLIIKVGMYMQDSYQVPGCGGKASVAIL